MASKPLRNPRHEKFAVLVASGVSVTAAHEQAGFARNPGNARRLRGIEQVAKRIEALLDVYASKTIETVAEIAEETAYARRDAMRESLLALNLALAVEQPGAAVAAVALRSKLNGLLVDRKEIGGPGAFSEVSDDELRARLLARVERLGLPKPEPREIIEAETIESESEAEKAEKGSAQRDT